MKFPKPQFNDSIFAEWLCRATWWDQLAVETSNLFDATVKDMGLDINYFPDREVPVPSLLEYIETMRILLWKTAFDREFAQEKGIHKNKKSEDQVGFVQAMRRVLFRYFKFVLFSRHACGRTPPFFANYLDTDSEDCMFTDSILKTWDRVHLPTCGWYLDCPLKKPPFSEVLLRESLEPSLTGKVSTDTKLLATQSVRRGRKRKLVSLDDDSPDDLDKESPMFEGVQTSLHVKGMSASVDKAPAVAPGSRASPISGSETFRYANVVLDLLPKAKDMVPSSSTAFMDYSTSELVLNDSFMRMVEEKQSTGMWPLCYDDIVAFLTKVCEGWELYFGGKVEFKPAVDLIIAEYPDGLRVPGVSDPNFKMRREVSSYYKNYNFKVKEEWTIVNFLHLASLTTPNKNTLKFKALLLVRRLPFIQSSSFRQPKELLIVADPSIPSVHLGDDDVLFNSITSANLTCNNIDGKPWRGPKEKSDQLLELFIHGLSLVHGIVADLKASTGSSIKAARM